MIGLSGPNGTGKSTLAQAFAKEEQIPFVATSASEVFRRMDLDPKADYPFEIRMLMQETLLMVFERQYEEAAKLSSLFITDRTPIDLASYLLADVQRSSLVESPEMARQVTEYVAKCFKSSSRFFSTIILVQPGIQTDLIREGKAPSCPAYQEHLNTIQLGLLCDERNMGQRYVIPRRVTDLAKRVDAVRLMSKAAFEANQALKSSRTWH